MSLDDERMPWPAAEAIQRGEDPENPSAQFRLARLLAEVDDLHTIHHQMRVAGRVLAFLPRIVTWADAEKPQAGSKQLRSQQVAEADDETTFLEHAHHHLKGYRDAMAALAAMGSVYAAEYDPDERGVREDDRREREARQDEAAVRDAPSVRAS